MLPRGGGTAEWRAAEADGSFGGSPVDRRDGFIHLSAPTQVRDTAALHFADQTDLFLVAVDSQALGAALRWEPSRGGLLFPHLFGDLSLAAVRWSVPLPLGADSRHIFPDTVA